MTARAVNVKHSCLIDNPIVFKRSSYKHWSACFSSSQPSLNETHRPEPKWWRKRRRNGNCCIKSGVSHHASHEFSGSSVRNCSNPSKALWYRFSVQCCFGALESSNHQKHDCTKSTQEMSLKNLFPQVICVHFWLMHFHSLSFSCRNRTRGCGDRNHTLELKMRLRSKEQK